MFFISHLPEEKKTAQKAHVIDVNDEASNVL